MFFHDVSVVPARHPAVSQLSLSLHLAPAIWCVCVFIWCIYMCVFLCILYVCVCNEFVPENILWYYFVFLMCLLLVRVYSMCVYILRLVTCMCIYYIIFELSCSDAHVQRGFICFRFWLVSW